ncbi:MAG: DUF3052 domain-containing protein [Actinobacteria bacterium]|nr:DUF3052 domain-containing protein [Actinomycetota bacterium]MCB9413338.1 DUF3052 domain-containing protein [Actinomycetota bacterium]
MEIGWDSDCDESLRAVVAEAAAGDLLDEDSDEVVDVVLLWWRDEDGDLVDALMDAITPLADHGTVWLLTPKSGREGHIEAADIAEAAPVAGLQQTSTISASKDWQGTRLVSPRAKR